jgi:ribonuclease D
MTIIATTETLAEFCERQNGAEFVTVDTEFMRESTYWPKLCLVQVAGPEEVAVIDALADGIDLAPLDRLMLDPGVLKVFHAARQDLEIFYQRLGEVPKPIFDTQIAAMVCGFGESVGYETLVSSLTRGKLDKSSRLTDWSQRPLTERQLAYAEADVVYLRTIHEKLRQRLERTGRAAWLTGEMAILTDPATYRADPQDAWLRLKPRSAKPRMLAVLRELAAWREREAQRRDVPRNRVVRDDALVEIAGHAPRDAAALGRTRGLSKGTAEGRIGAEILEAVARGLAVPEGELPAAERRRDLPSGIGPVTEMLKVLLKLRCEQHHVAPKLVASSAEIEEIAGSHHLADIPALTGWRYELFGRDALAMKRGEVALAIKRGRIEIVPLDAASDGHSQPTPRKLEIVPPA